MASDERIALVTGASSGFGLLIAVALARAGFRVVASMRNPGRSEELMREAGRAGVSSRLDVAALDVADAASIEAVVTLMKQRYGRLDVLVNNAGFAAGGFIEEVPMEAWRAQMETNFFGVVAVTRGFLPLMRAQGSGMIIQISSVSGQFGLPGYGAYAASKFAVEGFSESLRHEMAPHGVRVVLVEPGAYRTPIWAKGFAGMHVKPDSPYRDVMEAVLGYARRAADTSPDPQEVADLVARLAGRRRPLRLRYPIGRGSKLILLAAKLLPWRLFESLVRRALTRST